MNYIACNINCTGCSSATVCTGCSGSDLALRDPSLTCACKSTAWNNGGICTCNKNIFTKNFIYFYLFIILNKIQN